jgi:hypothetical protein
MLGWIGGAGGAEIIAAQMPPSLPIGVAPLATKPRGGADAGADAGETQQQPQQQPQMLAMDHVEPLFEKKLSKEEKKMLAEEKRKAKKAAKEAAKGNEGE